MDYTWETLVTWQLLTDDVKQTAYDKIQQDVAQGKTDGQAVTTALPDGSTQVSRYWATEADALDWISFVTPLPYFLNGQVNAPV